MPSDRITIRIDDRLKKLAQTLADQDNRTLSNWIIRLIKEEIARKR